MLGCGSVGRCALPLVRRHIDMPADRITVMDFEDVRPKIEDSLQAGVRFKQSRLTQENYASMLGELVGPGDIIVDLSWNVETLDMLAWCGEHDVRYLNTSLEEWDPYGDIENKSPYERSLYSRQMRIRLLKKPAQFAKQPESDRHHRSRREPRPRQPLHETRPCSRLPRRCSKRGCRRPPASARAAFEKLIADAEGQGEGSFARLSQATGTKVIHISERDTQVSSQPKAMNEFVNTWSIEGFFEEGTAPAELGWGTHERRLPKNAHVPIGGPGNQIFLAQPGIRTFVHSWVPAGGPIIGMVVRHAESFSISDHLTVWEDTIEGRLAVYRPTVHYAYMPCDNAILSLYELAMRNFKLQPKLRIMSDEIVERHRRARRAPHGPRPDRLVDRLAAGHPRSTPAGAGPERDDAPGCRRRAGRAGLHDPQPLRRASSCPTSCPTGRFSTSPAPYLGPCPSVRTNWTPLESRSRLFAKWGTPAVDDADREGAIPAGNVCRASLLDTSNRKNTRHRRDDASPRVADR